MSGACDAAPTRVRVGIMRRWQAGDGIAALILLAFSVPKLIGAARSVEGFGVIGAFLGVDPLGPRLATGAVELAIAALLAASVLAPAPRRRGLATLGHLLLIATMGGALFTELVVRPGAANGLLVLALALGAYAGLRLAQLRPLPRRIR